MALKKVRKVMALILSFAMVLGLLNLFPSLSTSIVNAAGISWPATAGTGWEMPFRPTDSLVTTQNPPDFSWPFVTGAVEFELEVSRNADMAGAVHTKYGLTKNFYNFPQTFEAGIWYWHVRYKTGAGWSEWSMARKFRIEEQNVPFVVPSSEEMMAGVSTAHPRIWTNPDDLDDFRALAQTTGKDKYETTRASVMATLDTPLPAEPTFPYMDGSQPTNSPEYAAAQQELRAYADAALNRMQNAAFIYLISGDQTIGANAKAQLINIASWDPFGATKFEIQDQVHRAIAYRSAIVYDWIYDLLSEAEKQDVREMIKTRTTTLFQTYLINKPMYKYPYDSHGWTILGYTGIIATAMLHDIPEAANWYREAIPTYINIWPFWGGDDGSWSSGTGYWQWSTAVNKELMDVLLSSGAVDMYQKPFSRNESFFPIYAFPFGTPKGGFGDDSQYLPGGIAVSSFNRNSQIYQDQRFKWSAEAIGAAPNVGLQDYFYGDADLGSRPPVDLPQARWFENTGLVAMQSDLVDRDRVSFYFKSTPYGTAIHNQADQNGFLIYAFGEPLAVKTGFYDYYGSQHHFNYTRQTFSANAITYDGRKGQTVEDLDADGQILGFATHPNFDATSGDATIAYKGGLSKAIRRVIYLRPSMFLIIDDLATNKTGGSEFEFNLHAEDQMTLDEDSLGATISKGKGNLKVRFHSPAQLKTTYSTKYLTENLVEVPPTGGFAKEEQVHATFTTAKTNATKIISTMEAYTDDKVPQNVVSENKGDYMKLSFTDGSVVYVRLTDSGIIDTGADNIQFDGAAVAVKGNSILLQDGTKLIKDGITVIDSTQVSTIAYGGNDLSVSVVNDAVVTINAPEVTALRDINSGLDIQSGGTVAEGMNLRGMQWTKTEDILTLNIEKGQKGFKLNNVPKPGPLAPVTLNVEIDGNPSQVNLQAYSDINGASVAWGNLVNAGGFYEILEAPVGLSFVKFGRSKTAIMDPNTQVILSGDTGTLKMRSIGSGEPAPSEVYEDPEKTRQKLSMLFQEAEEFIGWSGKAPSIYSTRPFLSNGTGVSSFDQQGMSIKWKFDVPKAGKYDFILKHVNGWDLPTGVTESVRYLQIGNDISYFKIPKTADYGTAPEIWKGLRVKTGTQLNAGPVDVTMWHQLGGMNLDWIALIEVKDDEEVPGTPVSRLESQVDTSVTIAWDSVTDNVAVKEYVVYANGIQKSVVTADTTTATITGLTLGETYNFTVRAVDTSDNYSNESNIVSVTLKEVIAPVWEDIASIRPTKIFSNAVSLEWDEAEVGPGSTATYTIYQIDADNSTAIATVSGTSFDVINLQPGNTYRFKVEAKNEKGKESVNGLGVSVTLPATGTEVYDTFDHWTTGEVENGNGWTYTKLFGTSVQVVELPEFGGKGLQAIDSNHGSGHDWDFAPTLQRSIAPFQGGTVTLETKIQFSKIDHSNGNYEMVLMGGGKELTKFLLFDDGAIGYKTPTDSIRITPYGTYKQPSEEWMTLRFDIDFGSQNYALTIQADSLKEYKGNPNAAGTLDRTTGIYRVENIPFLSAIDSLGSFSFKPQYYTGRYTFDYLKVYRQDAPQTGALLATPSLVGSNEEFPVSVGLENASNSLYQEVVLEYDSSLFEYTKSEPAKQGVTILESTNDTLNGTVRIKTTSNMPLGAMDNFVKVFFRPKNSGTNGTIAISEARTGASEQESVLVNMKAFKTISIRSAPIWSESLLKAIKFPKAVRLIWDETAVASLATDATITGYTVYQKVGSAMLPVGTENGAQIDIPNLQPGATYTFKVEAKDSFNGQSTNGPTITVTLPETSTYFYDSFDDWTTGEVESGNSWTYTKLFGTSVQVVELPEFGGKGLQAIDSNHGSGHDWDFAPTLQRSIAPLQGGKVTVETKVQFSKIEHANGNYGMALMSGGKELTKFYLYDDGAIGYIKPTASVRITSYGSYKQSDGEWMTLRFDIDFGSQNYELTIQADSLKNYTGNPDAAGTLDRETGIYHVENIPFLNAANSLDGFSFKPQYYTGQYTFDYLTIYREEESSVVQNSTISPETGSFDKNVSAQADIATMMTLNGNTLSGIANGGTALVLGTDFTVDGNVVTIKKEYLASQPTGTTNLVFTFSAGATQTLVIAVSDSGIPNPAPIWGETAELKAVKFPNAARLTWDEATAVNGTISGYTVYQEIDSEKVAVGTAKGTQFDVLNLQPGETYTFKIEAEDSFNSQSTDGPEVTVTLPETSVYFYDSFDNWETGEVGNGNSWTYTKDFGTSVQVVELPESGGKGLQAIDSNHDSGHDWDYAPTLQRSVGLPCFEGGKVTVETKIQFSKINHDNGNYEMDLMGGGRVLGRFYVFTDGAIGYKTGNDNIRVTFYDTYKQPSEEWMTLRFDIDFDTKTYDITMQADSLKTYNSTVHSSGTLNKETGVIYVKSVPFVENAAAKLDTFRFRPQYYTGQYTFDYLTIYREEEPPVVQNSFISPATGSFDKEASAQADVTTTMTLNGNTLSGIANGETALVLDTDYAVTGSAVTIKKEYLANQPVGTTNLVFTFSAGAAQTLVITVADTTVAEPPIQDSVISPATGNFDKKVSAQTDVTTTMTLNGNTLSGIANGETALVLDTDYTVTGSAVTIKKEYLANQPVGTTNLVFTFSAGVVQTLVIAVVDTTVIEPPIQDSVISPATGNFDKKVSAQTDVTTTMTLNGNTLSGIVNGETALVLDTDYTVTGSAVTIKKEYLANQPVGTTTLTFTFSAGAAQTLVITVADTTVAEPPVEGPGTPSVPEEKDEEVGVLVNGKLVSLGTSDTTTIGNKTVTTVTIDQKKMEEALAAGGKNSVITIPISSKSDVAIAELTGSLIQSMEQNQATLEIKTGNASYTIQAQQINIQSILEQLGNAKELKDIKIQIEISAPSAEMVKLVESSAINGEFSIAAPPVNFSLKAVYGNETVELSQFNAYVKRTIAIPEGVDPTKVTTAVVVDSNGGLRHVPTRIILIDGKYHAEINSLTNSTYTLIWNPVAFKDVDQHWAKLSINDMGSRMILSGTGNGLFNPDKDIICIDYRKGFRAKSTGGSVNILGCEVFRLV